jgi:hypothetical protein
MIDILYVVEEMRQSIKYCQTVFRKNTGSGFKVEDKKVTAPARAAMKHSMNQLSLILNILRMAFQ